MALEQRWQKPSEFIDQVPKYPVRRSPLDEVTKLARLHDEAIETALLANILGRTPHMIAALAAFTLVAVVANIASISLPDTIVWLIFMFAGAAATWRTYSFACRAPFARPSLRAFYADMKAVSVYNGFAFGAGAFLILPADSGVIFLAAFSICSATILAAVIRDRDLAIAFIVPVTVLSAAAAALRPMGAGAIGVLSVLLAGTILGVAVLAADRIGRRSRGYPSLAHLPLS
ncbi:MAG TPA: hypothetical protein VH000_04665 [Rhizomicrobium sp.]|jgi:hypothetical protein|nr:hypothetical protein [Rhizomicrobium sp.]